VSAAFWAGPGGALRAFVAVLARWPLPVFVPGAVVEPREPAADGCDADGAAACAVVDTADFFGAADFFDAADGAAGAVVAAGALVAVALAPAVFEAGSLAAAAVLDAAVFDATVLDAAVLAAAVLAAAVLAASAEVGATVDTGAFRAVADVAAALIFADGGAAVSDTVAFDALADAPFGLAATVAVFVVARAALWAATGLDAARPLVAAAGEPGRRLELAAARAAPALRAVGCRGDAVAAWALRPVAVDAVFFVALMSPPPSVAASGDHL
jgi:hypothetical protein